MREIEFRGKRTDGEGWVYGNLARYYKDTCITFDNTDDNWSTGRDSVDVIPETVGQYTGLQDKNGVKIFEGDVVEFRPSVELRTCIIKYVRTEFVAERLNKVSPPSTNEYEFYRFEVAVIGNIHDNPEILASDGTD